nr:energy-coupling factor transporter ATPase [Methanoculleus sp. FWC-SCC1]
MPASRVLLRTQHRPAPDGGARISGGAARTTTTNAPISMRDVSYTYPQGTRPALAGIDLDVARGECLLVTGPTGAGKTTLCLAASGILYHEYGGSFTGTLSLAGKDVAAYRDMGEIGRTIGVVFDDADAQLIFTTVEEEVASGLENQGLDRAEMQRRMDYVVDVTGIGHLLERAPHTLSGGQKQRVAIAATLALGTDVLFLDEPTAELDTIATDAIFRILQRLKEEGKTIVIVEHKIDELSRLADRMILIEDGRIADEGVPEMLLKSDRVRSLIEVACEPEPVTAPAAPVSAPVHLSAGVTPIITVHGLVHRYDETAALAGVDLEIFPGEIVAIVGENGSGKTTLVKHFNGLLRPTEGTVLVDGLDTATTSITELARHVGLVFQNPDTMLFAETVAEEIAFGLGNIGLANHGELIDAVLAEVGLSDYRDQYPRSLSRGERQRLALACVIAMRPKVIVLDEPTTGLDARETQRVMEIVQRLQREGCTILMVTHNMRLVREYADRIIAMEHGTILRDTRNFEEIACQKLCSISTGTATFTA